MSNNKKSLAGKLFKIALVSGVAYVTRTLMKKGKEIKNNEEQEQDNIM